MITLYQLHWSHYVEKVRWALDYKNVEWSAVDVDPFTKRRCTMFDDGEAGLSARRALAGGRRS
jgi:glutathione S-transferase